MDPCYFYTGKLTRKSDVYAFRVVLFEVLSGRQAVDSTLDEEQWGLAPWAQGQIKEGKVNQIMDPRMMGQISKKCLKEFASLASRRLHTQPKCWVDERTYAPTKFGVGLAIYVRKKYIETWKLELELEDFNHPNLVKLLGYCSQWGELYCFYELFRGTTSLDKYLFIEPVTTSLPWVLRLKIAVGAAKGLAFLHRRKHPTYSQFKTNRILVDKDFNALLSDFEVENLYATKERFGYVLDGLAGICSSLPEDGAGVKSEISAFGAVLLEILTGMKLYDEKSPLGKQNLVEWAYIFLANEFKLGLIMDPQLQHNGYPPKGAFKLAQLVLNCLQSTQTGCLSLKEIEQVLCGCYKEEIRSVCS
ncbi:unnamed protein product [Lactuca virosa]|uniref:Protein kinase domain-containing protein n=1 Tax=Lactuca virosa TaxID=75947 RepID=A0AAU9PHW4_9ASTR|nr:unnamed protein product [Lactuca virosa]